MAAGSTDRGKSNNASDAGRRKSEPPGIAFEKIVAQIQARIDPSATVTHNETLVDRIGNARQFDVAVRGQFGGQPMLGVIECKDLTRRVGPGEVDAFVIMAENVNANFKILMSRRGFTEQALAECRHHDVRALSLLHDDPDNEGIFLGVRWTADFMRWTDMRVDFDFVNPDDRGLRTDHPPTINGKPIYAWFTNYLSSVQLDSTNNYYSSKFVFNNVQRVAIGVGVVFLCRGLEFRARRVVDKRQRVVKISGPDSFAGATWH